MKLSELDRFSVEAEAHPSGGMMVSLFVLGDKRVDAGSQRSLDVVSVVSKGKDETDATSKGIEFALELLASLKKKADIIKLGVRLLSENEDGSYSATVQFGLFDKAEEGADLIIKKTLGFGRGKDIKSAQKDALASALKIIGEK
jgi:hypothetical protein